MFRIRGLDQVSEEEDMAHRANIFHTKGKIGGKIGLFIIDNGSWRNLVSSYVVEKLKLPTQPHPRPYDLQGLSENDEERINYQCMVPFSIGKYQDQVLCDVVSMDAVQVILGKPWQVDLRTTHHVATNRYHFRWGGIGKLMLVPLSAAQVRECIKDMRENKLRRQREAHDKEVEEKMAANEDIKVDENNVILATQGDDSLQSVQREDSTQSDQSVVLDQMQKEKGITNLKKEEEEENASRELTSITRSRVPNDGVSSYTNSREVSMLFSCTLINKSTKCTISLATYDLPENCKFVLQELVDNCLKDVQWRCFINQPVSSTINWQIIDISRCQFRGKRCLKAATTKVCQIEQGVAETEEEELAHKLPGMPSEFQHAYYKDPCDLTDFQPYCKHVEVGYKIAQSFQRLYPEFEQLKDQEEPKERSAFTSRYSAKKKCKLKWRLYWIHHPHEFYKEIHLLERALKIRGRILTIKRSHSSEVKIRGRIFFKREGMMRIFIPHSRIMVPQSNIEDS